MCYSHAQLAHDLSNGTKASVLLIHCGRQGRLPYQSGKDCGKSLVKPCLPNGALVLGKSAQMVLYKPPLLEMAWRGIYGQIS